MTACSSRFRRRPSTGSLLSAAGLLLALLTVSAAAADQSTDALLIVCYLVATSLTVVSIAVQRMEARGEVERARRVDRRARWLVPVVAALILGVSVLILWS